MPGRCLSHPGTLALIKRNEAASSGLDLPQDAIKLLLAPIPCLAGNPISHSFADAADHIDDGAVTVFDESYHLVRRIRRLSARR